ncbi:hypothetical protein K440DRAFT_399840 [Wilcoxina mikolae CBS 423.85]|nr:hypothetical protein K440DRAFT_399840 [Wilcoxina mikolae CBS 423.85]
MGSNGVMCSAGCSSPLPRPPLASPPPRPPPASPPPSLEQPTGDGMSSSSMTWTGHGLDTYQMAAQLICVPLVSHCLASSSPCLWDLITFRKMPCGLPSGSANASVSVEMETNQMHRQLWSRLRGCIYG